MRFANSHQRKPRPWLALVYGALLLGPLVGCGTGAYEESLDKTVKLRREEVLKLIKAAPNPGQPAAPANPAVPVNVQPPAPANPPAPAQPPAAAPN